MVLLRYFAGVLTWLTIILFFGCIVAFGAVIYTQGTTIVIYK